MRSALQIGECAPPVRSLAEPTLSKVLACSSHGSTIGPPVTLPSGSVALTPSNATGLTDGDGRTGRYLGSVARIRSNGRTALAVVTFGLIIFTAGVAVLGLPDGARSDPAIPRPIGWGLVILSIILVVGALVVFIAYVAGAAMVSAFSMVRRAIRRRRRDAYVADIHCMWAVVRTYGLLRRIEGVLSAVGEAGRYWSDENDGLTLDAWDYYDKYRIRGRADWRSFYLSAHDAIGDSAIVQRDATKAGLGAMVPDVPFVEDTLIKVRAAIDLVPDELRAMLRTKPTREITEQVA